jgi:glycosyltransferase 2 family protein
MDNRHARVPSSPSQRQPRWLLWALRGVILAVVSWGIYQTVQRARDDLARQETAWEAAWERLRQAERELAREPVAARQAELEAERRRLEAERIDWRGISATWLAAAGALYLAGGVPCWIFWHQALRGLGQRPAPWDSLRAYWIGHLGKYLPGKALVVVLRATLVRGPRVDGGIAAVCVFVETLTMMSVGAAWSAVLLLVGPLTAAGRAWLPWALALMVLAGFPTAPPLFRRAVEVLQRRRGLSIPGETLRGLNLALMLQGWFWMSLSWLLMGLSLWATLRALPGDSRAVWESLADLPAVIACAALAVVLGFASLLPGGVGVRELVVVTVLAPLPHVGSAKALAAALLARLVWLLAEVAVSGILYVVPAPGRRIWRNES